MRTALKMLDLMLKILLAKLFKGLLILWVRLEIFFKSHELLSGFVIGFLGSLLAGIVVDLWFN